MRAAVRGERSGGRAVRHPPRLRHRMAILVAWIVRSVALISLISLFTRHPARFHDHHHVVDALADGLTIVVIVALAALMLIVARGLSHHKRRAWRIVMVVEVLLSALYLHHRTWDAAALNLVMVGMLWWTRGEFRAESEPSTRWLALRAGLLSTAVSFGAGMALNARTAPDADSWPAVRETVRGLLGFFPDLPYRRPELGTLTDVVLTGLGISTVGVVLVILLSPRRKPAVLAPADEDRLRELLRESGDRDSLGYFALRRDKSVVFSPSGKAAIAYRVVGGVSLASGDPLGEPEAWPGAIEAWLEESGRYAWTPGVLGAGQDGATAFVRAWVTPGTASWSSSRRSTRTVCWSLCSPWCRGAATASRWT